MDRNGCPNSSEYALVKKYFEKGASLFARELSVGHMKEARNLFLKVVELDPKFPDGFLNLGVACRELELFSEAIAALSTAVDLEPENGLPYFHLGWVFERVHQFDKAIRNYRTALKKSPELQEAYIRCACTLESMGIYEDAIRLYRQAHELNPEDFRALWGFRLTLPKIYDSEAELYFHRDRWSRGVTALLKDAEMIEPEVAMTGLCWATNFRLHYQGFNSIDLQREFGKLISCLANKAFPNMDSPVQASRSKDIRKLGFVSSCFRRHTVSKLFGGWIKLLNRDMFEVHLLDVGGRCDAVTSCLADSAVHHNLADTSAKIVVERVIQLNLDVIIYLEVGMSPIVQLLAALRLAPTQCCAWGHPVTTGLPTIDYFLTSELMEPDGADEHYTETVIRLPSISIAYSPPAIPSSEEKPFISHKGPVFACTQSLFKLLPQYDRLFSLIAAELPASQFIFISDQSEAVSNRFLARLSRSFASQGLKRENYVRLIPRLTPEQFLRLNASATAVLDSVGWSGGNTTLEALACDAPVVTCRGNLMRACHSSAILEQLGVPELIAADLPEYIKIATRLGNDCEWRDSVRTRIRNQKNRIFNDKRPVKELERFLSHL